MLNDKEIIQSFEILGFTSLEAKVYLYVLKNGRSSVTKIYQSMKLDKSSTYRVLDNLVLQNLISLLGDEYGREYIVSDPNLLIEIAKKKEHEVNNAQNQLKSFLDYLSSDTAANYKNHNIQVYEGIESVKILWEKRLSSQQKLIREIATADILRPNFPDYDDYMSRYVKRRVEKGIFLRGMTTEKSSQTVDELDSTNTKFLKEFRVLPKSFTPFAALTTFDSTTAFHNATGARLFGVVIEDIMITNLINYLFDQIWEDATPSVVYKVVARNNDEYSKH